VSGRESRPGTDARPERGSHDERVTEIRIHAPDAEQVWVVIDGVDRPLTPIGPVWRGSVPDGSRYGIRASGDPARRFDRVFTDRYWNP